MTSGPEISSRPGGPLLVRTFRPSDEPGVVRLWNLCFPRDPSRNEPAAVIARKLRVQPELFLVGILDDEILCTALGGYDGFRGWIYHLATHPDHRRRGHASRMMREIESRLAELGCPKLNLQIRGRNEDLVEFYRSLGYSVEDRVSMGRKLEGCRDVVPDQGEST